MRTAYINKENKVVYIAAFEEDRIQADGKGKFRFGGSVYDAETGKWNHTFGLAAARTAEVSSAQDVQRSTEEVFEVDGSGLGVGDVYMADKPQETQQRYAESKDLLSQKEGELAEVRKQMLTAQADEEPEEIMQPLREKRDALKAEVEKLKAECAALEQNK